MLLNSEDSAVLAADIITLLANGLIDRGEVAPAFKIEDVRKLEQFLMDYMNGLQ